MIHGKKTVVRLVLRIYIFHQLILALLSNSLLLGIYTLSLYIYTENMRLQGEESLLPVIAAAAHVHTSCVHHTVLRVVITVMDRSTELFINNCSNRRLFAHKRILQNIQQHSQNTSESAQSTTTPTTCRRSQQSTKNFAKPFLPVQMGPRWRILIKKVSKNHVSLSFKYVCTFQTFVSGFRAEHSP